MTARNEPSAALIAMREALADGEWHDGWKILLRMQRAIPPGVASRSRFSELRDSPAEAQVEQGRRRMARIVLTGAIKRRTVEVEPQILTRAHWSGSASWRVRQPFVGALSVERAAEIIGVTTSTIRTWVKNEFVPYSQSHSGIVFTPEQMEVMRQVHAAWPGPNTRWSVDPRSLWDPNMSVENEGFKCPHCNEPIQVIINKR